MISYTTSLSLSDLFLYFSPYDNLIPTLPGSQVSFEPTSRQHPTVSDVLVCLSPRRDLERLVDGRTMDTRFFLSHGCRWVQHPCFTMLASGQRGAPCESLVFLQGQVVQPENTLSLQDSKRKCPALGRAGWHWARWPSCLHSIGQGKSSREEPALGIDPLVLF